MLGNLGQRIGGFLILTFMGALPVFACDIQGASGILPENDLKIGINDKNTNNLTEKDFNNVIDRIESIYRPMVAKKSGKLVIKRLWREATVNAAAIREFGEWQVEMYGGLARHPLITEDAFALVLCHEIGHHMGGAPQKRDFLSNWASNEGQADYFATTKCFRLAYGEEDNLAYISSKKVPPLVENKCNSVYANPSDAALCMRMSLAGLSLSKLFASLGRSTQIDFSTPDTVKVAQTFDGHPKAQCRLDTYFQGSLCDRPKNEAPSNSDVSLGFCTPSQGDQIGNRPLCWYHP